MDDLKFVRNCVKKDKQSWHEFLQRYSRLIYNYIYHTFQAKGYHYSSDEIADIFQDILYSLIKDDYKKLSSYKARNGCSLASWLRQVTINSTVDHLRKFKKPVLSIDQESEDGFSLKDILADNSPSVGEFLADKEKLKTLDNCIEILDAEDKYLAELLLNQLLTPEEIGGHLKINRSAVDMRKLRMLGRLRDCFAKKGFKLS